MRLLGKRSGSAHFSSKAAKQRLIVMLILFAIALLIPLGFLANHVYKQFAQEMQYKYKRSAERLVRYSNKYIHKMMYKEEERTFNDYTYFTWVTDPLTGKKKRVTSPLAHPKKSKHIPGYVGHFQIDGNDQFSSPLLPTIAPKYLGKKVEMAWQEIDKRLKTQNKIEQLLIDNGLLKLPKIKDTESSSRTEESFASKDNQSEDWRPSESWQPSKSADKDQYTRFVVEVDPFQWRRSEDGYYFFYRKVWRKNQRYVQGFILSEDDFLTEFVSEFLAEASFASDVEVSVVQNRKLFKVLFRPGCDCVSEISMHAEKSMHKPVRIDQAQLRAPLQSVSLAFSTNTLPLGPGAELATVLLSVVAVVIGLGLVLLYRAGSKQILLAEERLNFVSAVSHELKTPLTSILMYSEMLKHGMVEDQNKQKTYYDFIFFESERLSRLISNVLHLSRLSKDNTAMDIQPYSVTFLKDLLNSKVSTLLVKHDFEMTFSHHGIDEQRVQVLVDQDAFAQIAINLVDNAIKFSSDKNDPNAFARQLDMGFKQTGKRDHIQFFVRDYGPGVSESQREKIFELFYRVGDELTRTKPGTGIGLALVSELANAMQGQVELINHKPGAEFCVTLPVKNDGLT